MGKICSKCEEFKDDDLFYKNKVAMDGLKPHCKACDKAYKEKYKDRYAKQYKNRSPLQIANKRKSDLKYKVNNPHKVKIAINNAKIIHKERMLNDIEYRDNHRLKMNIRNKRYRKNNPWVVGCRKMLYNCRIKLGTKKPESTNKMLGYSAIELKEYLESLFTDGMSWDNYGEWHIDHIRPVSSFNKGTPMSVVNALSNLQPLWATTREINGVIYEGNLNKGDKY